MSLQKAIDKEEDIWEAFDRVLKEHGIDKPWQPSEDTQYKKDLTAWIERKKGEWVETFPFEYNPPPPSPIILTVEQFPYKGYGSRFEVTCSALDADEGEG